MGKQVNFYMNADDEREFIDFVRTTGDVAILRSVSAMPDAKDLVELPPQDEPFWFALCLWNRDCSPPPILTFIPEQRYYCIENTDSEVIEFHRCHTDEGRIKRGRIWAEMAYWQLGNEPSHVVQKSDEFKEWYERLANWIRRHAKRDSRGEFVFAGAARDIG